jgi:RNA polymerase sigma factor (sigma-70 family)
MNERRQDFELLQRFTRDDEQSAFADVVRRHLDLVFATALRKVEDPGAAQEVAQNVFTVLARKAWQFAPDDSLPAWLHKTALLESKSWLRGELRRRRREETAAELGTTMNSPDELPAFHALVPLLDDALLSLREKDRTVLLLRYYESQSLRDVGAAFGASEDAARKRVQSALEKLAECFKRRGFKTASVAAAAAALQHTAASASAAMVGTVVSAALKVAPAALVGLSALLARLVSLSRVQTAAVCVALAAVPVGWQLNERHAAGEEAKRMQTQLLATQNEGATVQAEIERLRASAGRLEQSVAQANAAAARAAASAQAFEAWKNETHGLLTAVDYRWSDDSAFVRIPKSALPELSASSIAEPFAPPGVVLPYARELMGLTPSERQSLEATLQRHFADLEAMDGRMQAGIYETNGTLSDGVVASKVFVVPDLGLAGETRKHADQILAEIRGILGEERWPVVQARLEGARGSGGVIRQDGVMEFSPLFTTLRKILHDEQSQKTGAGDLWVNVETDKQGKLTWFCSSSTGYVRGELSMFLPEGDPNRTKGSDDFGQWLSDALRRRASAWLQEQAAARLGRKEKP